MPKLTLAPSKDHDSTGPVVTSSCVPAAVIASSDDGGGLAVGAAGEKVAAFLLRHTAARFLPTFAPPQRPHDRLLLAIYSRRAFFYPSVRCPCCPMSAVPQETSAASPRPPGPLPARASVTRVLVAGDKWPPRLFRAPRSAAAPRLPSVLLRTPPAQYDRLRGKWCTRGAGRRRHATA